MLVDVLDMIRDTRVFVVATTSRLGILDDSLRVGSRFVRAQEVLTPTPVQRLELLRHFTKSTRTGRKVFN